MREHDLVVLKQNPPDHKFLRAGDVGSVVRVHDGGMAFDARFATGSGQTLAMLTLGPDDIRHVGATEVLHVRGIPAVFLGRNGIVGARIQKVLRTRCSDFPSVFVVLDNGLAIQISDVGDGTCATPIPASQWGELSHIELEDDTDASLAIGQIVEEVVVPFRGPFWSLGLALSNDLFLSYGAYGSHSTGSIVDDSKSFEGEIRTYWEHDVYKKQSY